MSKQYIQFTLSKNGQTIGKVEWTYNIGRLFSIKKSGQISGDEMAIMALNQTIEQAKQENWECIAPDFNHIRLSDPLSNDVGMLSLLVLGGFDIPPELMPHYRAMLGEYDDDDLLFAHRVIY